MHSLGLAQVGRLLLVWYVSSVIEQPDLQLDYGTEAR
jgi:hypothetical protein